MNIEGGGLPATSIIFVGSTAPRLTSAIGGPEAVYRFGPNYVDLEKGIGLYLLHSSVDH